MLRYFLYTIFFASLNFLLFSAFIDIRPNLPSTKIDCASYVPYKEYSTIVKPDTKVPIEKIRSDLQTAKKITNCIRIYSSLGSAEDIVKESKKLGIKVILGSYLTRTYPDISKQEIINQIRIANAYSNVFMVLVGNENLRRPHNKSEFISLQKLIHYIEKVKSEIKQPVSTGEVFKNWRRNTKLVNSVDFIAVHLFPYWAKDKLKNAERKIKKKIQSLKKRFPGKSVFLAETGWPTAGQPMRKSAPSLHNQRMFIENINKWLDQRHTVLGIRYNLVELFDQPWKSTTSEGNVASHWGLFYANGKSKYMDESFSSISVYTHVNLVLLTTFFGFFLNFFLMTRKKYTKIKAVIFCCFSIQAGVSVLGLTLFIAVSNYIFIGWAKFIIVPMLLAMVPMLFVTVKETADVLESDNIPSPPILPKEEEEEEEVSIHVACCNEPPEQVIKTLQSLLDLAYSNYEIVVVDNNTKKNELWEPVQNFCEDKQLIKFFHEPVLKGFKAGALNYALKKTSLDSKYIAVIDSDYVVHKNWLKNAMPNFQTDTVAVQCPQNHTYNEESTYQRALYNEYDGFFQIGMVQRSLDNAIIMHGTMVIIQKNALEGVGGWAEWSICEDAELGVRLLQSGKKLAYKNQVNGKGVLPATYSDFRKQRFRWVYGGVQIMLKNLKSFVGIEKNLTSKQKYHFFWWWSAWIGDGFYLICSIFSTYVALKMLTKPAYLPSICYVVPMIYYSFHKFICVWITYKKRLSLPLNQILALTAVGISLTGVISVASLYSLISSKMKFHRTTKKGNKQKTAGKVWLWTFLSNLDCFFSVLILSLAIIILASMHTFYIDRFIWILGFVLLSLPGLASIILHLCSYLENRKNFNT